MNRKLIRRTIGATLVLLTALTLSFAPSARADDDDYRYRHDEAREHGYHNGYDDGVRHGRYDHGEGYRYNVHSQQFNDGRDGYQYWMGNFGHYKKAYRTGYEDGYRQGFNSYAYRRDRDGDRDDYRRRDGWR
jgi:hypothetical protein